jgi:hypothetical protein
MYILLNTILFMSPFLVHNVLMFILPLEGSGISIVLSKGMQIPVLFNGSKDRIVIVSSVVDVVLLGLDGTTDEHGPDLVGVAVVLTLIPGQQDSSILGEILVSQERFYEAASPVGGISQGGVVTIVVHVGAGRTVRLSHRMMDLFSSLSSATYV